MNQRTRRLVGPATLALALSLAGNARAGSVATVMDNDTDAFVPGSGTDWNYTQGARIAWYPDPGAMPRWAEVLAGPLGGSGELRRFGLLSGQEIYTPRAIETAGPVPRDRPYAGWLYGSAFVTTSSATRERSVQVLAGVVGPGAFAGEVQSWWHQETGVRLPRGWGHQLRNEPGVELRLQERRRPWGRLRWADVVPQASVAIGNVHTEAGAGATLRLGLPLPDDFGPSPLTPIVTPEGAHRIRACLSGAVEGRYVAHNVFLDGNTFGAGPSVTRIPWVGEARIGIGVQYGAIGARYSVTYRSYEFRDREQNQKFGSIALSF